MARDRVVVGSMGDDGEARRTARRLRDEGLEVVFVGGHQTAEQLARAAVAEDATRIVVAADQSALETIAQVCRDLGAGDVVVGAEV